MGENTDLRFSWGRFFQSQGIHQLQIEDGETRFFPAQRADHAIVGIHYRFADYYRFRAEAYHKTFNNLRPRYENLFDPLAVIPELEPDRVRISPDSAQARGVELSLYYDGPGAVSWWGSYVRSQVTDRIAGDNIPRSWDQPHAIQLGVAYNTPKLDVALALNAHSGWPNTSLQLGPNGSADNLQLQQRNADRYDSFASLDFRVNYKWALSDSKLSAFFEVSNATNRANPCCTDYELESDNDGNLALIRTNEHWFGILPSIGILWEF